MQTTELLEQETAIHVWGQGSMFCDKMIKLDFGWNHSDFFYGIIWVTACGQEETLPCCIIQPSLALESSIAYVFVGRWEGWSKYSRLFCRQAVLLRDWGELEWAVQKHRTERDFPSHLVQFPTITGTHVINVHPKDLRFVLYNRSVKCMHLASCARCVTRGWSVG